MQVLTLVIPWRPTGTGRGEPYPRSEWLVTNGLGGFASGALTGAITRRYHGLLVAARHDPPGRYVLLDDLGEAVHLPDSRTVHFGHSTQGVAGGPPQLPPSAVIEFRLEDGLPGWRYELDDFVLEKHLLMPYQQNTVLIRYRLVSGDRTISLDLQPLVHFRSFDQPVSDAGNPGPYRIVCVGSGYEIQGRSDYPPLRLRFHGAVADFQPKEEEWEHSYSWEQRRSNPEGGKLWACGTFRVELRLGTAVTLIASDEGWQTVGALQPQEEFQAEGERRQQLLTRADPRARAPEATLLVLAADQFLVKPVLHRDYPSEAAAGELKTILAGYHWFTDWGRDALISLEGLTLTTGRHVEARCILLMFAAAICDGLIPNHFPEGETSASYHTADTPLWFFHAVQRYVEITEDGAILQILLPKLKEIITHLLGGTRFGIGVDPNDGLVSQGTPDFPLTWMDAKVENWVVTPRRGKAVEINALWYNALRLLAKWLRDERQAAAAQEMSANAERVWRSFNDRFWYDRGRYLYDVVDGDDGDDPLCRPNQIFSLSLHYPVLDPNRWHDVFHVVRRRLLTPVGLRSLAPGSPGYQPVYFGDRRSRDAAYHQGTVWPWLLGPYIDAWLRVRPGDRQLAHQFLIGILRNLGTGCIGSLNEIFDGQEPHMPRGCIAQAWSVAEVLRAWVRTAAHHWHKRCQR